MPHFLLEQLMQQLDRFAQCHNLSLAFGTTNFVHHFTFGLIKNGARETPQASSWEVIVHTRDGM